VTVIIALTCDGVAGGIQNQVLRTKFLHIVRDALSDTSRCEQIGFGRDQRKVSERVEQNRTGAARKSLQPSHFRCGTRSSIVKGYLDN